MAIDPNDEDAGAIIYYDKALAINPKYENALYNKGLAFDNLGNYNEAIKYYDKALAIQPNDTYALNSKGAALNSLGNYTGAILYYDKVLPIDPRDENTLYNKGLVLDNLRNYTGAIPKIGSEKVVTRELMLVFMTKEDLYALTSKYPPPTFIFESPIESQQSALPIESALIFDMNHLLLNHLLNPSNQLYLLNQL